MPAPIRLEIRDFAGVIKANIDLGTITAIYGPNEAGKSSVVDAIGYAFTGSAPRSDTLAGTIRQGRREAFVELDCGEKRGIIREIRAKDTSLYVDGVETKVAESEGAIAALLGCSSEAAFAALRPGIILELDREETKGFLERVGGVKVDAAAIAKEIGADGVAAFKALKWPVPATLKELDRAYEDAVDGPHGRKKAKQKLKDANEGMLRAPLPAPHIKAALDAAKIEQLRADLKVAESLHARAVAGADVRIEQWRAVPRVDPVVADDADLVAAQREHGAATSTVTRATAEIARLRAITIPVVVRIEGTLDDARKRQAAAAKIQATKGAERDAAKARIAALEAIVKAGEGQCMTCLQHVGGAHVAGLQAEIEKVKEQLAEITKAGVAAKKEAEAAAGEVAAHELTARTIEAADRATAEKAKLPAVEKELAESTKKVAELDAKIPKMRAHLEEARAINVSAKAYRDAQAALAKVATDAPAGDVAALAADVTRLREVVEGHAVLERHMAARKVLDEADTALQALEAVALACNPKTVGARIVAGLSAPFLAAANQALATLSPGTTVALDEALAWQVRREGTTCTPKQLSSGARRKLQYVLQYATARLAKAPLVALDETELLDAEGRQALKAVAKAAAAEGIKVLILSSVPPASVKLPPGATGYTMTAGVATPIGATVVAEVPAAAEPVKDESPAVAESGEPKLIDGLMTFIAETKAAKTTAEVKALRIKFDKTEWPGTTYVTARAALNQADNRISR